MQYRDQEKMGIRCRLKRRWHHLIILVIFGIIYVNYKISSISMVTSAQVPVGEGYKTFDHVAGNGTDNGPGVIIAEDIVKQLPHASNNLAHNHAQPNRLHHTCNETLLEMPAAVKNSECVTCGQVTCKNLLKGGGGEPFYGKAVSWMTEHPRRIPNDSEIYHMAKNCTNFKMSKGYILQPLDGEEANYPIAYNIIVHKDAAQVENLLRAIYRPQNAYCIHVDGKSPEVFHSAIKAITDCFANVFIVSKTERIVYAGFSRLQADINCMSDMVKIPGWQYLINLAGQAYPLKTNSEIVKILKIYNGANDIEGIYGRRILKSRFQLEWEEVGVDSSKPELKKTGRKNPPPPYDIEIVRGSAYGVFSRDFVQFLLTDEKAKALLEWSRKTYSPDEHYWATLHHTYSNPHIKAPGAFTGYPNEKPWLAVFVAWGGVNKCAGQWRRGTCVFGVGDLPGLTTRKELFANKFYADFQPLTLDCLEAWMKYQTYCPPDFDELYYRNLPFIRKGGHR